MKLSAELEESWMRRMRPRGGYALRGGFYLSPQQFGYTTAQAPAEGFGGGEMSTATAGAGGGEGGGGAAAGGGGA